MSVTVVLSIFIIVAIPLFGSKYIKAWIDKQQRLSQLDRVGVSSL